MRLCTNIGQPEVELKETSPLFFALKLKGREVISER
ncbi:hypothetical protein TSMEX_001448 [Taenia solium]|eukprot:TsM_000826900 transcript=TsM_000826900 gene=TsM_000826900